MGKKITMHVSDALFERIVSTGVRPQALLVMGVNEWNRNDKRERD